jgi:hypothetical protein
VHAVGADDHARRQVCVQDDPVVTYLDPADPALLQHGAGRDGVLDQPGVEHFPRDDVHLTPHRPGDTGVTAGELEVPQRGPAGNSIGGADGRQDVEHVRGDPVAAALVPGEVGPVEQQHAQSR